MQHTIQDFIVHERSEMSKNIDRIKHGLNGGDADDPHLAGQLELLALQEEHLQFINELSEQAVSFGDMLVICRQHLIDNEQAHAKIARKENHTVAHGSDWWRTLDKAQFCSDFINRIHTWQQTYLDQEDEAHDRPA